MSLYCVCCEQRERTSFLVVILVAQIPFSKNNKTRKFYRIPSTCPPFQGKQKTYLVASDGNELMIKMRQYAAITSYQVSLGQQDANIPKNHCTCKRTEYKYKSKN